jgi:hypothetical protein
MEKTIHVYEQEDFYEQQQIRDANVRAASPIVFLLSF